MRLAVLLFTFFLGLSFSGSATTYYVSATGNDQHTGTSPATAWQHLEKVNDTRLEPGDVVLLEGGSSFSGGLWLRGNSQGSAGRPIVFGSYGQGHARIASGNSYGFYAHNTGGLELRRLDFVGAGRQTNTNSGVIFFLDSANVHLQHLVLDSVTVQGYRSTGISIGSWNGTSGYDDVRLTNCRTSANGEAGLAAYAQEVAAHHRWYVSHCQAFDNAGRPEITTTHTGSGIVLAGLDGALVEYCEAYNNGWLNANPTAGPVGIWGWGCNNLIIQQCESHHNHAGPAPDGGGFDLDGGCTNSWLQYNYSHDNDGPGYRLGQYEGAAPLHDVTIRYNISENDARRHGTGAILLWSSGANGGIQRASLHNNTVYLTPPPDSSHPEAVAITSAGMSDVTFRNNLFQTTQALVVLTSVTTEGVLFQGNAYWGSGQPLSISWGPASYGSLADWRTGAAQETIGAHPSGICVDPQLRNPGAGGKYSAQNSGYAPTALAGYQLQPGSALLGAGLDLAGTFGQNPGPRDFFGTPTPAAGFSRTIGAYEYGQATAATHPTMAAWCTVYPNPARSVLHLALNPSGVSSPDAITVRLVDLLGRPQLVQQSPQPQTSFGAALLHIPLTALAPGRYQLEVIQGHRRFRQAVVVE